MDKLAEKLQYLIDIKNVVQQDIANGTGINRSRISELLNGKVDNPRRSTLRRLADYFGCDLEWLATGTGAPFPTQHDPAKGSNRVNSDMKPRPETVIPPSQPSETVDFTYEQEECTIRDIVNMTMEVMESDTVYKSALASSVRAFHKAVKQEGTMKSVEEDVAEMRERMERMEQMLLSLGARLPKKRDRSTNS